jgi:hypothetical protein
LGEYLRVISDDLDGDDLPASTSAAGRAAEGVIVGAAWNLNNADESNQAFIKAYTAKTGKAPDQFASNSKCARYSCSKGACEPWVLQHLEFLPVRPAR